MLDLSAAPVSGACQLNGQRLRFARAGAYIPAMDDLAYWTKKLQEAERELEAARTRTAVNAAAKKLHLAKSELRRLEKALTRQASGVAAPAASS